MQTANEYEIAWWKQGKQQIIGIDEAGRGPIAGPLVVAGVCFPVDYHHEEIYDSKKISEKKRKELFRIILQDASWYKILIISPEEIDTLNIYRATQKAMETIASSYGDGVLTDAMPLPNVEKEVLSLIKGDQKSVSIAAASILAKVTRDCIMKGYDRLYPAYGFAKHKGYPTKGHLEALHRHGVLPIYRKSYAPVAQMNRLSLDLVMEDMDI